MSNTLRRWRATWYPDEYHGWGRKKRYFEGWYFKVIDAAQTQALAFIPGISMDEKGQKHAFIQVMNGKRHEAQYHRFEASLFHPSDRCFWLELGGNHFSRESFKVDLPGVKGEIRISGHSPWPKMLGAPGIMGWYSFVPFMQCFHGIVSMNHRLEGSLEIDGQSCDFSGGKGYIEKDWGRSFPKAYVWMQSNHFAGSEGTSLMASVAHIPWLGSHFIGFISGFLHEGKLHRFATYTGARKHLQINGAAVSLSFINPDSELRIYARQTPGVALVSPLSGAMTGKIQESLEAEIQVEFLENGKRVFEGTGTSAGLELAGALELLLS